MLKWLKRLFCRHEYEKWALSGLFAVNGHLVYAQQYCCTKCGKVKTRRTRW